MPELPDITVYVESLGAKLRGDRLQRLRVLNPFVLRTALPPVPDIEERSVTGVERLGKRVVIALDGERFVVIHLMIAGRLKWLAAGAKPPARGALASLAFAAGTLVLTEAGTQRRASIHLVQGREALAAMDPGGIDPLAADAAAFAARLALENHTLKHALTNPHLFSGIGNAYSDEILHRAQLSPVTLTSRLAAADVARLHAATREVLAEWTARLRGEARSHGGWPQKVTAFRPEMAVHGRYGQPCPVCGSPVQRIVHADNETNYCARCQTGGKLLADRALSTLLKRSWPKHIDDLD
ncbi:MAG: DNA-formamidopyrimidine glycosylase family protein [Burkholderiaceae bacterium]